MSMEGLQNYLGARLPLVLNAQQHFRLLWTVFGLVFVATLAVHLLVEQVGVPLSTLTHAVAVGLVYVVAVGIASTALYALRGSTRDVRVWHVWITSLTSFVLGYYFLPIDEWTTRLLGDVIDNHTGQMTILQLAPVWFLLTYVFVQPYLNQGLALELSHLREINALLEQRHSPAATKETSRIHFVAGRTDFTLEADAIRNITVEDHYCYVHYQHNDGYAKRDLAMPLRDVRALLPDGFLLVHRSHVVNLKYVVAMRRKGRTIRVVLDGGYDVPVSRHRIEDVLPLIRQQGQAHTASTGHGARPDQQS